LKVASGEQTLGRIQVFESFSKLTSGLLFIEDTKCLGIHYQANHMTDNVVHVKEHVGGKRRITVHEVINILGIPFGSFQSIVRELDHVSFCH
jgi:hypothetical protein